MKVLSIIIIIVAGATFVMGRQQEQLIAVGVPESWLVLVQGCLSDTVEYVGGLGLAGVAAARFVPQAILDRLRPPLDMQPPAA